MNCQLCGSAETMSGTDPVLVCRDCLRATAAFVAGASKSDLHAVWIDNAPRGVEAPPEMETDPRFQEFLSATLEERKTRVGDWLPGPISETHADLACAYSEMGLYGDSVREAALAVLKDDHPPALPIAARLLLHEQVLKPGGLSLLKRNLRR